MVYKHAYLNTLPLLQSAFITVAAIRIYAQVVKMPLKLTGELGGHVLNCHGNYIVDHGKSWKIMELCF